MAIKIEKRITAWGIKKESIEDISNKEIIEKIPEKFQEVKLQREDILDSKTYKIKPNIIGQEHSYYITIGNQIVNGENRIYEIFISTKGVEHIEWVSALARMLSALLRSGVKIDFIIEELIQTYSPMGGYMSKRFNTITHKKHYYNSIVGEIGGILKEHIEMMEVKVNTKLEDVYVEVVNEDIEDAVYPPNATKCPECKIVACVLLDGCYTCLSCGASKCN